MFDEQGEFKFIVWGGDTIEEGQHPGEAFIWHLEGEAEVCDRGRVNLGPNDSILIKAGEKFTVRRKSGAVGFTIITDPLANKPKM